MRTDGQTDMTELIVAFGNFAKAPKNVYHFTRTMKNGPDNSEVHISLHNCRSSACNWPNVTLLAPRVWMWLLHFFGKFLDPLD
jgi:hypothetical protein